MTTSRATPDPGARPGGAPEEDAPPPAPWHFKVLLVATALYLVYRIIWFGFWLAGHAWHG
ncbi:MAG: hypothetical protein M0Z33_01165 [Actinomycetota bacterium]|nr:hypothetical protein [Actinomycetota bacterium]